MSAKYDKNNELILLPFKITQFERTIIESQFDFQTDYDVLAIEMKIEEDKLLRRICLVKTLLFPFEYILMRFIAHKKNAEDLVEFQSVYWNFFLRRIDSETLANKLLKKG
jgi:hypothetical protein